MPTLNRGNASVLSVEMIFFSPFWPAEDPLGFMRSSPNGSSAASTTTIILINGTFRESTQRRTALPLRFMKVWGLII